VSAAQSAATLVGEPVATDLTPQPSAREVGPDADSRAWVAALRDSGPAHDAAVERLYRLLIVASRKEVRRRAAHTPALRGGDVDDIAAQSAHDAVVAVLAKLDTYRGLSRFSTWAYKFALLEAAVAMRKRAWQGREVVLDAESWSTVADRGTSPSRDVETTELLGRLGTVIRDELTPHQREVLVALAVDGVPIDVLADRLSSTRGALYKTLHDARRKLRARLETDGLLDARKEGA
jgi:RNA polymerase sigma-70 factor (ECF subfamily)